MNNISLHIKRISWLSWLAIGQFLIINIDLAYRMLSFQEFNPKLNVSFGVTFLMLNNIPIITGIVATFKKEINFKYWILILVLSLAFNSYALSTSEYLFKLFHSSESLDFLGKYLLSIILGFILLVVTIRQFSKERLMVLLLLLSVTAINLLFSFSNSRINSLTNNLLQESSSSKESLAIIIQAPEKTFKTLCKDLKFTCVMGVNGTKEIEKIGQEDVESNVKYILESMGNKAEKIIAPIESTHEYNKYSGYASQEENKKFRIIFNSDANQKITKSWEKATKIINIFIISLLIYTTLFTIGMSHSGAFSRRKLSFEKEDKFL